MKKTIGILAILLVSISVFGQPLIKQKAAIEIYSGNLYAENGELIVSPVHFIANDRIFMVSYEPLAERVPYDVPVNLKDNEVIEAELFLYSRDLSKSNSDWEIASVEDINGKYKSANLGIYVMIDAFNYDEIDFETYGDRYEGVKNGKVVELPDGSVEMVVMEYGFKNGSRDYAELLTFVFTPVDNNHYTFKTK